MSPRAYNSVRDFLEIDPACAEMLTEISISVLV